MNSIKIVRLQNAYFVLRRFGDNMWDSEMPVVRPCPGQCAWTGDAGQVLDMAGHWPVRGQGAQSASQWARVSIISPASITSTRCEPCHQEQGQILSQYQCQACPHSSDWRNWQTASFQQPTIKFICCRERLSMKLPQRIPILVIIAGTDCANYLH